MSVNVVFQVAMKYLILIIVTGINVRVQMNDNEIIKDFQILLPGDIYF